MNRLVFTLISFGFAYLLMMPLQIVEAKTIIEGTDRVLVEVTNDDGEVVVESVLWDDINTHEEYEEGDMIIASGGQKGIIIEPDYIRSIHVMNQDGPLNPWSINRIGAVHMQHQLLNVKKELIVAVVDSGIDRTHPFLQGRIIQGYNVLSNSTETSDAQSHGTHIAGIITDTTTANIKIMPIAAIGKDGKGYDSNIARGIRIAVDRGAKVINLSVGGKNFSQHLSDAIDYAITKNVLIVVSSGNEGDNTANYYPASDKRVITVTATNQLDEVAKFSNTGATVDISAPGVGINSTIPGGKFGRMSGTSMATPYVTSVAAMLLNEHIHYASEDIVKMLKMYVDDLGNPGWDAMYGMGLLNVAQFEARNNTREVVKFPRKTNVPLNKEWTITVDKPFMNTASVAVTLHDGTKNIPVTIVKNGLSREIKISPQKNYDKNKTYQLAIHLNQKKYTIDFTTTNQ